MKDENLLEAFNAWENLSQTQETIIAYQSRLKVLIDEEARLADVREEGIEEGIEQGVKKVAQNMIAKGKSNEEIMDVTDLTLGEVEALRKAK